MYNYELHSSIRVAIKPAPGDTGRPCGVDYELKAYVIEENETEEKFHIFRIFLCFFNANIGSV